MWPGVCEVHVCDCATLITSQSDPNVAFLRIPQRKGLWSDRLIDDLCMHLDLSTPQGTYWKFPIVEHSVQLQWKG